jgi:Ca2+/Na+ antiporter
MFENFFSQFNIYLLGHPSFMAKLKILFWIKYWALLLLMAFFLFLVYREQAQRKLKKTQRGRSSGRGDHCMEA